MPRAYFFDGKPGVYLNTALEVIAAAAKADADGALCIVENISPSWEQALLDAKWTVSAQFFRGHHENPTEENLWDHIFDLRRLRDRLTQPEPHIHGIFEYPGWVVRSGETLNDAGFRRRCWKPHGSYPISSNTKISYIFAKPNLCLVLVDAPLDLTKRCTYQKPDRLRTSVRFPYSTNRGGLMIPSLYRLSDVLSEISSSPEVGCSLFENFVAFSQHAWHVNAIFRKDNQMPQPHVLLYLLSASLWRANFLYLDQKIKHVSFKDLRRADMKVNSVLHDCREDLFYLRAEVSMTLDHMPAMVDKEFSELVEQQDWRKYMDKTPRAAFNSLTTDADNLSHFLIDSFSLLISSVSTRDSQTSLEQAKRATLLTQLALIYVPLSFVTGIFGMNMQEINQSPLSLWVSVVTLVVVVICTAGIFGVLRLVANWRERKKLNTNLA